VWVDADAGAAGSPKYELNPLKTPPGKGSLTGHDPASADAHSAALSAAQKILEGTLGGGNMPGDKMSPVISNYNRMETNTKRQKATMVMEKLVARVEATEGALERATRLVAELNAEREAAGHKSEMKERQKEEHERGWASEAMVLQLQLKEAESSDTDARKTLLEKEREIQVLQAELQSLERTAKTIEIVKEQAYESAKREVGAQLAMQESRLESQGIELGTLTQANNGLMEEREKMAKEHNDACSEVVAWRTRAEAAELELKSLGRYASTKEEKRSLEIARLLNSKVVGVGLTAADLPVASAQAKSPKAADTSTGSWGVETGGGGEVAARDFESKYRSPTRDAVVGARWDAAQRTVVTSADILTEAWSAQKALAERLDKEIYLAGFKLEQSMVAHAADGMLGQQAAMRGLTGSSYRQPTAWK
jgi:hypothetical protein